MTRPLLEITKLVSGYENCQVLNQASMTVSKGSITCLLGPNGAGKTTLLMTIIGLLRPQQGSVKFDGAEISGFSPHSIFARGLSVVPQSRQLFLNLTVRENLEIGAVFRKDRDEVSSDLNNFLTQFPQLKRRCERQAGQLSGGEQQILAMVRALISRPKLLLLDEPSLALAPLVIQSIYRLIEQAQNTGTTVLLIEQNAKAAQTALGIADDVYLMNAGVISHSSSTNQSANGKTANFRTQRDQNFPQKSALSHV